jgi:pimeloyl-ACP methyl ester carboxylesterase
LTARLKGFGSILLPNFRSLPKSMVFLAAAICILMPALGRCADEGQEGQCVILLHGLGRTDRSMNVMAEALASAGYATSNLDYPSRDAPVEKLALDAIPRGLGRCRALEARRIHFVTHSMGGILVRYYLSQKSIAELGRVVMLSPPNQGSEVTDALQDTAFYQWHNGPAGQQLGTGSDSFVLQLGPVDYPVGGDYRQYPRLLRRLAGRPDTGSRRRQSLGGPRQSGGDVRFYSAAICPPLYHAGSRGHRPDHPFP